MYQRICCPTDGTDRSERAVRHAVDLAAALDATVYALAVKEPAGSIQRDRLRTDLEAEAAAAVEGVEDVAARAGITVQTDVRAGEPADAILEYAGEYEIELLVVGTGERTGIERILDDSVAATLLERSAIPVLTVPARTTMEDR